MRYPLPVFAIPLATKIKPDDPPGSIGIHAVPVSQRCVRKPVLVVDPVCAVRGIVEGYQSGAVGVLDRDLCGSRGRVCCGRDRGLALGHSFNQSRFVDPGHPGVGRRPGEHGTVHCVAVLVERLRRQPQRVAKRDRALGRRHHDRTGRLHHSHHHVVRHISRPRGDCSHPGGYRRQQARRVNRCDQRVCARPRDNGFAHYAPGLLAYFGRKLDRLAERGEPHRIRVHGHRCG